MNTFFKRKAQGGKEDTRCTLMVCEAVANDKGDTVVKGMPKVLRDLSKRNRPAGEKFPEKHEP
jgi:3-methyladenine DNA glycosylase AlkD